MTIATFKNDSIRRSRLRQLSQHKRRSQTPGGSQDWLFAPDGVTSAFDKIGRCYAKAGATGRSRCRLADAPHQFNLDMQAETWEWLGRWV